MKTETRTVFIADDGTEFDTEAGAATHERYLQVVRLLETELSHPDACDAARLILCAGTFKFEK